MTNTPQPLLPACKNVQQSKYRLLRLNISESKSNDLLFKIVDSKEDVSAVSLLIEIDGKEELFIAKTITYIISIAEGKVLPMVVLNWDNKTFLYWNSNFATQFTV